MELEMMNTRVRTMAAGSSSGTTLAVNLTLTPAGKRVCSTHTHIHTKKFEQYNKRNTLKANLYNFLSL